MTKRKLINKKAYEEMELLKKLVKNDELNTFIVSIQIGEDGNELFIIDHYFDDEWTAKIVGENYTEISKRIIRYSSKL